MTKKEIEMSLKTIRRLAADILKCGESRVRIIDAKKASEALTREDVKGLIDEGVVKEIPMTGVGRGKARLKHERKHSGRRRGEGSKKGGKFSSLSRKDRWMSKVRSQRKLLAVYKQIMDPGAYKKVYFMVKGNSFRDKKHLREYLAEKGLMKKTPGK